MPFKIIAPLVPEKTRKNHCYFVKAKEKRQLFMPTLTLKILGRDVDKTYT